ncbi:MAG: PAS domain-containing protein [Chitinophagaceae bacterium]|nr:PAS domain-containing protein [Chitinophagaceae bacterium]
MVETMQTGFTRASTEEYFKSINRFQLLSIATKEGIWEYDFNTKQSFYNEGMIDLFGYEEEEMADNETWWRNNLHPQDKKRVITEVDEVMASPKSVWWGKYQFRCKDGSYRLILDRLFVVRDSYGKTLRLIGTMQDLTEIDALQQDLEKIRKQHHKAMIKAIFQAEENERKNISQELNENINQVLAAINMHLAQAKGHVTPTGLVWLQEAQGLLLDSISGISNIAKRLSPIVLKDLGLETALNDLLKTMQETRIVSFNVFVDDNINQFANFDVQTVIYRIVQEQVLNILKHSVARNVQVKVQAVGKKIKIVVEDDGMGINLKDIQYGKGFSNIQEKTEAMDGSFNLESVEGKPGFRLEVMM